MQDRILIVGSAKPTTGFGRVIRCLADTLSATYDIHVLGHDVFTATPVENWTLHPGTATDIFATGQLGTVYDRLRPDVTLIVNDYWFIPAYLQALRPCHHRGIIAAYIPVDAHCRDPHKLAPLGALDALVVYTEFARRVIQEAFAPAAEMPAVFSRTQVIPHGIATTIFSPRTAAGTHLPTADDRIRARTALASLGEGQARAGFWVLNANKNAHRKRLDLTLEGFARFARDKPADVRLYLHAGRRDTGPDLQRLAHNLRITERLIVTRDTYYHPDVSAEHLNLIYNACDVGLNTAMGEGWGLVTCEHAATGAAQIVPRHSAFAELWPGAATFIEPTETVRFGGFLEGGLVSAAGIAAALECCYQDRTYLARMSLAAYHRATTPAWSWPCVARRWDQFFRATLADGPRAGTGGSHR